MTTKKGRRAKKAISRIKRQLGKEHVFYTGKKWKGKNEPPIETFLLKPNEERKQSKKEIYYRKTGKKWKGPGQVKNPKK